MTMMCISDPDSFPCDLTERGAGVWCAGDAHVCVVEGRAGIGQGGRGQEGRAGEEDSDTQGSVLELKNSSFFRIRYKH